MRKISSLKGKILSTLLLGTLVFFILGIFFVITTFVDTKDKIIIKQNDYAELNKVTEFKTAFELYQFEVNRLISKPNGFDKNDITNNPFRKKIQASILNNRTLLNVFNEYNNLLPVKDDTKVYTVINNIQNNIATNTQNEFKKIERKDNIKIILILSSLIFWFIMATFIYLKILRFIKKINKTSQAIQALEYADYNPELVCSDIPMNGDAEFFELANRITKIVYLIHQEKQRIYDFADKIDDENSKHRIMTSYTNAILNSLDVGILVTDNLDKISYTNAAFLSYWRVSKFDILDKNVYDIPFFETIKGWKNALQNSPSSFIFNYKMSGTSPLKEIMFSVLPVYDRTGKEKLGTVTITKEA